MSPQKQTYDLKWVRQACGLSQKQLADGLGVTARTVQNWEKEGCVPSEYQDDLRRVFGDQKASHGWTVDPEPLINTEVLTKLIALLNGQQYEDAILWGETATIPLTGEPIRLTAAEYGFRRALLGKAYVLAGRQKDARIIFKDAEEKSERHVHDKSRSGWHIWVRVYVESRNANLIFSVKDKNITLLELINELQKLATLIRTMGNGKSPYPYAQGKLHWNVLNAAMTSSPIEEKLALDAVHALIDVHGKRAVKYWIENDPDVAGALDVNEIKTMLHEMQAPHSQARKAKVPRASQRHVAKPSQGNHLRDSSS